MIVERNVVSWRQVLHLGLFPLLSVQQLEALRKALANDDPRLIQGATSEPQPLLYYADWPVQAACLLGWCAWEEAGGIGSLVSVGHIEERFSAMCGEIDRRLEESAAVRWLLNPYDDWPRAEMIARLLPEVEAELVRRAAA